MTETIAGYTHVFEPASRQDATVLLLLHGTGGDEHDLLTLGRTLAPGSALLSPRGQVLEHGMPRFFRRIAEGVFDLEDLRARTEGLAGFVAAAVETYGVDGGRVVAVGFSNGANMASSLLLLRPVVLAGAVLFRGMVPLEPDPVPSLKGRPILLSNGRHDPIIAAGETERLTALLRRAGADVTLEWQDAGHNLTEQDLLSARSWFAAQATV